MSKIVVGQVTQPLLGLEGTMLGRAIDRVGQKHGLVESEVDAFLRHVLGEHHDSGPDDVLIDEEEAHEYGY